MVKCPRTYARNVLPWQLLSRVLRLASLGCLLAAFHLPATLAAVLLVTFAQCSGRLVPFSPASVGTGAAILAACFEPVTGTSVPAVSARRVLRRHEHGPDRGRNRARAVLCGAQASAKAGPSEVAPRIGRLTRIRAAMSARP